MDTIRRVRAARGSLNLSLENFAKLIGMGRSTLVRIENGSREPTSIEYRLMAAATGLPLEFFTVEDLHAALAGGPPAPTEVDDLRHRLDVIETALRKVNSDGPSAEIERELAEAARQRAERSASSVPHDPRSLRSDPAV